tara:strand:- start:988 stop:1122 length:135 start_codon:yes stop_codon:yes gene_type:complete
MLNPQQHTNYYERQKNKNKKSRHARSIFLGTWVGLVEKILLEEQ